LRSDKLYDILTTLGFCLLGAGLLVSKFAVTLGIIILFISSFFHFFHDTRFQWKPLLAMRGLLVLFSILTISAIFSTGRSEGMRELLVQNGIITVPLLLSAHWPHFKRRMRVTLTAMIGVALIASAFTLLFYLIPVDQARAYAESIPVFQTYPDVIDKSSFGLYSPFIDRLQFAYALSFCVLICLYYGFRFSNKYYWYVAAFFLGVIMILGARGAQIGLLVSGFILGLYFLKWKFPEINMINGKSIFIVFAAFTITIMTALKIIKPLEKRYNQTKWELSVIKDGSYADYEYWHFTTFTRLKSYAHSFHLIKSSPILGTGIGDVKNDLTKIYSNQSPKLYVNIQNYYQYIWMCGGVLALLAFMYFQGDWLFQFFQNNHDLLNRTLATSFTLFIIVVLMLDAVMKYHMGAFGVPFYYMVIMGMSVE